MRKLKLYWIAASEWIKDRYTSGEIKDLFIMVGIGICLLGILSLIFF